MTQATRRATNQQNITVGLSANLLGAVALSVADAFGWADIALGHILVFAGVALVMFVGFTIINRRQVAFGRPFMDQFYWGAMIAQLPVFWFGAMAADDVRPIVLIFSMVLLGLLFLRANLLQAVAYGGALGLLYVLGSSLAPVLLGGRARLGEDLFYLLIWSPSLGVMSFLAGQQHRIRARLKRQREEIQALSEQRVADFRRIAHEIRNPLTMVLGPIGDLLRDDPDSEDLRVAHANANRLLDQVDRLLQPRDAPTPSSSQTIEVGAFVANLVSTYFAARAERGVAVAARVVPSLYAKADPEGLKTLLTNYVVNAIHHSPEAGLVLVWVEDSPRGPRIVVTDTGPGIRPEDQAKLFQPHVTLGVPASGKQGTGLGLHTVRMLADAMGAQVGVDSEVGKGSHFFVVLESALPPAPIDEDTLVHDRSSQGVAAPTVALPAELPERYLLVVEDDEAVRSRVVKVLSAEGWTVRGVANGDQALAYVGLRAPQLVVTDWMMPGKTGPELVKALRSTPDHRTIPVVMLTARTDPASRLEGTRLGAEVFLEKPFINEELTGSVRNLLRLMEREEEIRDLLVRMREDLLARFLPPPLVDDIVEGRATFDDAPTTHTLTTLVVDIAHFTKRMTRVRAATLAEYLSDVYRVVSEVAFLQHGIVDRFFGHGVSVHFGVPDGAPPEVQVRRAAECSRQLHRRTAELDSVWRRRLGRTHLRIGVHQGAAAVGYLGTERRIEYTAIGPSVDLAFRIRAAADAGATLVSRVVADYLDAEDVTPMDDLEIRGLPVFRLGRIPEPTGQMLAVGQQIDGFEVRKLIGEGGMAWIYEVWDRRLKLSRALKILNDVKPDLVPRLIGEGQIQARLQSAHIVPVLQALEIRGRPALLMPMIAGGSLEGLLDRYAPTEPESIAMGAAVARALVHAHAHGVVHRDLKPANVLLDTADGVIVPKVADFGLARDRRQPTEATLPGQFLGTPVYAAPEQFDNASQVGPPADVWALGAMLYELLTGQRAFVNGSFSWVRDQVARAKYQPARLPERWRALVSGMLHLDPERRPDARTVAKALNQPDAVAVLGRPELVALVRNEDEPTMLN